FGGFDGDYVTIRHDGGLTNIERPERGNELERAIDIAIVARRRLVAAEHTVGDEQFRRHIFDADDAQAAALDDAGHARQQRIVAAAKKAHDPRHQLDGVPVQPQGTERRSQHGTDEYDFAAILRFGEAEETPGLAERNPMVCVAAHHGGLGPALDAEHDWAASARGHGVGHGGGKAAAAANN